MRLRAWLVPLSVAVLVPGVARADEREACVDASAKAQKLKLDRKLKDAQQQLLICSRNECPALVRQDCAQWMNEVIGSLPSVVVGARDSKGRDLVQVKVTIDGSVVSERLEGKAISLDPGVHNFKYETTGHPVVEEQVVVREGEKNRAITVTFGGGGDKTQQGQPKGDDGVRVDSSSPVLAYVLGGVGIAAIGVGAYFGLHSNARAIDLRDGCGRTQTCAQGDVDSVQTERTVGWISAGVGVLAIGVAVVLLVTHDSGSKRGATWVPVASTQGGGVGVQF